MKKSHKRFWVTIIVCITMFSMNVTVVHADAIVNPNYTGYYYATSYAYINATDSTCYLHAFKFIDSGNWRYLNASTTNYYIGTYSTFTRGFNATLSGYDLCDSAGNVKGRGMDERVIIADSVDTWFDFFGNVTHRLINYFNISYIKTY